MPEKIIISCHYCGVTKDQYGKTNENPIGIRQLFRCKDNPTEYNLWFCGKIHRDFWLDEYREKIIIIGNT